MAENMEDGQQAQAPYLVVDYGEQLVADFKDTREELHKEVLSVIEKLHLLWDVLRCTLVLVLPAMGALGLALFSQLILPRFLSTWTPTVILCVTIAYVFLNLAPLAESVTVYLSKTYHCPKFLGCICARCVEKMSNEETSAEVGVACTEDDPVVKIPCEESAAAPEAGDTCPTAPTGLRKREVTLIQSEENVEEEGHHFEEVSAPELVNSLNDSY